MVWHNHTLFILPILTYQDFFRILLFFEIWIVIEEVDVGNILFVWIYIYLSISISIYLSIYLFIYIYLYTYVIYLIECKTCGKSYIGSIKTPFRARFNNYWSAQRNFEKGKKVKQDSFHVHFSEEGHHGEKDWVITLIDSAEYVEELWKNRFGNMNLIPLRS